MTAQIKGPLVADMGKTNLSEAGPLTGQSSINSNDRQTSGQAGRPGNVYLPIGILGKDANQEIGVPRRLRIE
jgi:hypothetical protein